MTNRGRKAHTHARTIQADRRPTERRCVVFADMVGYSALSSTNEFSTHVMWMDLIRSCLEPQAQAHRGRVVRLLGDGCLLSFDDARSALNWCLSVRATIVDDRVGAVSRWPRLSMRFAAHRCDVIVEKDDIFGAGVNITKRLQERAQADGILLSSDLRSQLAEDERPDLRYLGALEYRNISGAIETYEVVFDQRHSGLSASRKALGGGHWLRPHDDGTPTIAVMPFVNASGDRQYDYFAEGIIDDIIQSLASLKEMHVIARTSTLPFAGQDISARDVARILSARYVVQGAIRNVADKLIMNVSLVDAETDDIVFSKRSAFSHSDLFEAQDNIVREIVPRITPGVRALELEKALRKRPANFTAYQNLLRALDLMKILRREEFMKARDCLETAMELDATFALPVAWLVRWHCIFIGQGWAEDRPAAIEDAKRFAQLALQIDRDNPIALAAYGHVRSYLMRDDETAMVYFDRARQISPSHALTWILSSATLSYLGKSEEAVEHARMALKLSPNDNDLFQFYDFASIAHMVDGDLEGALTWANLSYSENPKYSSNLKQLVALNAACNNMDEARRFKDELLAIEPNFKVSDYRKRCPLKGVAKPGALADAKGYCDTLETVGL